jgi:hypothetical protein
MCIPFFRGSEFIDFIEHHILDKIYHVYVKLQNFHLPSSFYLTNDQTTISFFTPHFFHQSSLPFISLSIRYQ